MEGIRQWAWTICISSLCFSALRGLLPVKELAAGIKLVLQLYILLLLFSPAVHPIELTQVSTAAQADVQTPLDLSSVILQQTRLQLEELTGRALAAGDVEFSGAEVSCAVSGDEVIVEKVTVYAAPEQEEKIHTAVSNALGYLPECVILQTETDGSI